jgi:hypothetical protein
MQKETPLAFSNEYFKAYIFLNIFILSICESITLEMENRLQKCTQSLIGCTMLLNYRIILIYLHFRTRGVINGKAGKAAALPKFSIYVNPISIKVGRLCLTIGFASP